MSDGFLLKRWSVNVVGYSEQIYLASSRGKAMADAWRSYTSVYDVTFGEFIRRAKCRRKDWDWPGSRFGDPITVAGQRAFFCGEDGQYVHFARPGGEFTLLAHPFDVDPAEYRPRAYRDRSAA